VKQKYSREHTWSFDGGLSVPASSSPSVVPVPFSNPACVDPEEAFVASISSCHMLWFLSLAAEAGYVIESYTDRATALMSKADGGDLWISDISLAPAIIYGDQKKPTASQEQRLHHTAHERCFIANSIKTRVNVGTEPPTKHDNLYAQNAWSRWPASSVTDSTDAIDSPRRRARAYSDL
jgi:organic hydroperoxide reductase OsmC/OhrA